MMSLRPFNGKRRGATVLESIMAVGIVAAVLVSVAQLLVLIGRQQRASEQRMLAAREAGNLMEDLMSRPWSETTPGSGASVELSDWCRHRLPDAQLQVTVIPEGQADDVRRIDVRIDWRDVGGQRGDPVRLTAWKCRYEEKAP